MRLRYFLAAIFASYVIGGGVLINGLFSTLKTERKIVARQQEVLLSRVNKLSHRVKEAETGIKANKDGLNVLDAAAGGAVKEIMRRLEGRKSAN